MDKLMEMLAAYRCYLCCKNQKTSDFLRSHLDGYIKDLSDSVDIKDNKYLGEKACDSVKDMIPTILSNTKKIVDIFRLVEKGNKTEAIHNAEVFFEEAKPYLDSFQLSTFGNFFEFIVKSFIFVRWIHVRHQ